MAAVSARQPLCCPLRKSIKTWGLLLLPLWHSRTPRSNGVVFGLCPNSFTHVIKVAKTRVLPRCQRHSMIHSYHFLANTASALFARFSCLAGAIVITVQCYGNEVFSRDIAEVERLHYRARRDYRCHCTVQSALRRVSRLPRLSSGQCYL